jgi:diguanylate cyclase (GGDEF)-like protein
MSAASSRLVVGPSVTIVMAGSLWLLDRLGYSVPAPGGIMLLTIMYSTWLGGLLPGYASALIVIVAVVPAMFVPSHFITFTGRPFLLLETVTGCVLSAPPLVNWLRASTAHALDRERRTRERVEAASRELHILQAALDNVDYGVILLDENLRARFINRASRRLWNMTDELVDSRPTFDELMRRATESGAFAMPAASRDAYVQLRVGLVRDGDETPMDLKLANGTILRFRCKALPAGGRFLSYTDVTDLVRHAEALERLATTDDLTGMWNRRQFMALAEAQWTLFHDERRPFSLLILDLDLFKSINDEFGHNTGDAVIEHVAGICRAVKHEDDVLARLGGEEFVLMLPATRCGDALALAEVLRRRIEAEPLAVEGQSLRITASIGVAEADPRMAGIGDLLRRADQALYDAKREGRNRVRTRPPQAAPPTRSVAAA